MILLGRIMTNVIYLWWFASNIICRPTWFKGRCIQLIMKCIPIAPERGYDNEWVWQNRLHLVGQKSNHYKWGNRNVWFPEIDSHPESFPFKWPRDILFIFMLLIKVRACLQSIHLWLFISKTIRFHIMNDVR